MPENPKPLRTSDFDETSSTAITRNASAMAVRIAPPGDASPVNVLYLVAIVIESWKLILAGMVIACAATAAVTLHAPRTFTAKLALITVSNKAASNDLAGLAGGFFAIRGGGVDATPAFLMRLMKTDQVLRQVATSPGPDGKHPLINSIIEPGHEPSPLTYNRDMRAIITSGVDDKEANTFFLAATHRDSAVARLVATRLLDATTLAFKAAAKAQASQLREAQDARVAAAVQRLHDAELAQVAFARENRSVPAYSELYIRQQQLERATSLAQTVYTQAVNDRESAVAKELEETPALVVIEPIPATFTQNPRHLGIKLIVAAFASALLVIIAVVIRGLLTSGDIPPSEVKRLGDAVRSLPVIGRLAPRA